MTSSDIQVQGSNDWSIASKLSTVQAGYYDDPFISCFAQKPTRRSSLIHRGYWIRALAVDHVFREFLKQHPRSQIVSLGAGYDSSFFRLRKQGLLGKDFLCYVEIDFPDVVEGKRRLIQANAACSELIQQNVDSYRLISADLRDLPALRAQLLGDICALSPSEPTLFISECSITYMDNASSTELIDWCGRTFSHAVMALYEQIRPSDGFGLVMQRHFNQLGIPLLSLPVHPDKADQQGRFLGKGLWQDCSVYDMNDWFDRLVSSEERKRIRQLEEDFDEYEGFHQKCGHYVILSAAKGTCRPPLPALQKELCCSTLPGAHWELTECPIQRYGQASAGFFLSGGFGTRPGGQHGRLGDFLAFKDAKIETKLLDKRLARMYHSMDQMSDEDLVIFGGRTHPGRPLGDLGLYSVQQNRLEWIDPAENEELGIWPEPRWRHASCSVSSDSLLICGGRISSKVLGDCWTLSVKDVRWTRFPSLPAGRHSATVSCWGKAGQAILFGGLDSEESHCLPMCLVASLDRPDEWNQIEWNGPPPLARYSHRALIDQSGERLILVGGIGRAPCPPGVCLIQLASWTCVEYFLPIQDPSRPVILAGHSASLLGDEAGRLRIGCWAGGGPCFSFGTHLNSVSIELDLPVSPFP